MRSAQDGSGPILVGVAAVGFSLLYFASDVLELFQDGFSTGQLVITYIAEAAIPMFVLGLYVVLRPHLGRLGLAGAMGYAYAYIFYTGTVLVALVDRPDDWAALVTELSPWVTVHGALMVIAGSALGASVIRSGALPRWTGVTLIVGVVLVAVTSELPAGFQTAAAGVRDLGFAGMGYALIRRQPHP